MSQTRSECNSLVEAHIASFLEGFHAGKWLSPGEYARQNPGLDGRLLELLEIVLQLERPPAPVRPTAWRQSEPGVCPAGEPSTVPSDVLARANRPARAGRYEIEREIEIEGEIDRGGMGIVYRARDPELDRILAIKVLPLEVCGRPELRRRFLREAQITARLQHPNVPPIHEIGTLPDGRPYFAMKFIDGGTLAVLLQQRPAARADLPRFLTIFEQVCQTLAYAHSQGVVHRDLKPGNVMVGAFGEVQVMDWGLAKVLQEGGAATPEEARDDTAVNQAQTVRSEAPAPQTQPGQVIGTPAYMPPEQANGAVDRLDRRADVFGLGAILCEVLTGQPPYTGRSAEEVRLKAERGDQAEALKRLGQCSAEAELIALARACLAPEAGDRPADARAVAEAITGYLAGVQERLRRAELGRAAAQARAEEARATAAAERRARRRTRALGAALLALGALGAGSGLWMQHQAAGRRADQAVHEAQRRQQVESALDKVTELRQQQRWGEARAVLDQAREALGDAGPAGLRRRLDGAETTLRLVKRLDDIRQGRAVTSEGRRVDAEGAYAAAFREAGLGEVDDDEEAVAQRVRDSGVGGPLVAALDNWAFVAAPGSRTRAWLLGVARRADPDGWGNRFRDPAVWDDRQRLQALAEDTLRDEGAQLAEVPQQVLVSLGGLLIRHGADAVPLLRAALRHYPNDFWLNLWLGHALRSAGQAHEAVGYFRAAVVLRRDSTAAHNGLGQALQDTRQLGEAIEEYREAIRLDPKYAVARMNLGLAREAASESGAQIEGCRKAIELDPDYALAYLNLGLALRAKGRLDEATNAFRDAIKKFGPAHAESHYRLAEALRDSKDLKGAIAEFRTAARLYAEQSRPTDDPRVGHRYNAACCAALAAAVQAEDPSQLPHKVALMLRRQALQWLRADLALYAKQAGGNDDAKRAVRQQLGHWRRDADLASVRDTEALDKLPEDERRQWQQLWGDVAALLERANR
jgi:serine/threonine-protein kinase